MSRTFLSPFSSSTYPRYCPSTHTPAGFSVLVAGVKFPYPNPLFTARVAVASEKTPIAVNAPTISQFSTLLRAIRSPPSILLFTRSSFGLARLWLGENALRSQLLVPLEVPLLFYPPPQGFET